MSDFSAVKAQLQAKLKELTDRAAELDRGLSDPGNPDWEENAKLREDDEVMAGLSDITEDEIHEIKLALNRIESGNYGQCSSCGKRIPANRLAALPYTSTCVDCA